MKAKSPKAQLYNCVIASPIGKLGLVIINNKLAKIDFLPTKFLLFSTKNSFTKSVVAKINQYFRHSKFKLKLPIQAKGTVLQKKIWQTLLKISCGTTVTYGELARKIGTSPRVIGNACRCNPLPIVIPCHRVVATTGLGGYCGTTSSKLLKIKKWLLRHEHKKL